jgi:hypothetical protein
MTPDAIAFVNAAGAAKVVKQVSFSFLPLIIETMKAITPNARTVARMMKLISNPRPLHKYLPQFNEETGRWIVPKVSRRQLADIQKLALQMGFEDPNAQPKKVIFPKTVHTPLGQDGKIIPPFNEKNELSPFYKQVSVNSLGMPVRIKKEIDWTPPELTNRQKVKLEK